MNTKNPPHKTVSVYPFLAFLPLRFFLYRHFLYYIFLGTEEIPVRKQAFHPNKQNTPTNKQHSEGILINQMVQGRGRGNPRNRILHLKSCMSVMRHACKPMHRKPFGPLSVQNQPQHPEPLFHSFLIYAKYYIHI